LSQNLRNGQLALKTQPPPQVYYGGANASPPIRVDQFGISLAAGSHCLKPVCPSSTTFKQGNVVFQHHMADPVDRHTVEKTPRVL